VVQFGSAALSPVHAASLIGSSLATVQVVADVAQTLDWLDADAFACTLRNLEPGHAR
jgi:hypothetical protein